MNNYLKNHLPKTCKVLAALIMSVGLLSLGQIANAQNGYYALTFDDGPTSNTTALLNTLNSAGVKATFFIWGSKVSSNPSAIQAMANAGHKIENHSHTHQHMLSWSYQQVYNDLQQAQVAIQSAYGGTPTLFRPPYGETNATIISAATALGLTTVTWDIDTQDWNGASTASITAAASNAQNGSVILMHEGYTTTNNAIQSIVTNLKNRGLQAGSINNSGRAVAWSGSSGSSSSAASGSKTIVVRAKGVAGGESISLKVNNTVVKTWTLTTTMTNYSVATSAAGGTLVQYTNDATGRDVQVDYISVNGAIRQSEAQTTNTGVYRNGACGGGTGGSEFLHCNGYIGFGNI